MGLVAVVIVVVVIIIIIIIIIIITKFIIIITIINVVVLTKNNISLQAYLYLYDVPSLEHEGKTIGSIVFAESFLDSAIKTVQPGI